jgi:hypothetical protein
VNEKEARSMAKGKLPKRLFKDPDRVSSYQHNQSPIKRMKRMASGHEDVLQNIEFALVTRHRGDPTIDDRAVSEALRACIKHTEPVDPRAADLVAALAGIRELREDVPDDVWLEGLRVVEESVRRHSHLRSGEKSYLAFAAQFIT